MGPRSSSALVVWCGAPMRYFPEGDWVFPADWEALESLQAALASDFAETAVVPVADGPRGAAPLQLRGLRAFLQAHGAKLRDVLRHERVRQSTIDYGAERVAQLRGFGVAEELVEDALEQIARAKAGMAAELDLHEGALDATEAAAVVDVAARVASGMPLHVNIDVAPLALLALHCCVDLDAPAIDEGWLASLDWKEIPFDGGDEPAPRTDAVTVRASIYADSVSELAMADVRAVGAAARVCPGGAVVRISTPPEE
ncbi:MAG: hypothetical protein HOO96_42150 [Polyangiaceae bacterium]|nr:hypothetical protein [Polyangiaceae bacterium]